MMYSVIKECEESISANKEKKDQVCSQFLDVNPLKAGETETDISFSCIYVNKPVQNNPFCKTLTHRTLLYEGQVLGFFYDYGATTELSSLGRFVVCSVLCAAWAKF